MTLDQFKATLERHAPPDLPPLPRALWHAAKGEWDAAHEIAQSIESAGAAWVHAYLHRVEGDVSNARYWYRRAGQPEATDSTASEWARIAAALLDASR